ncbi:hypothetical protein PFLUOLIPICF7_22920 [Pseudomonas simiae]|nr:hypothetical protein PFLUOLIPICF7_22920 [Pseudomonas simiae]
MVNTRAESLTLEKVMCAVDELKKQGLKVTVKSVRDRTGCGSYTTISKLLKDVSLAEEKNLSPEARFAQFPQQIEAAFLSVYKELVKAAKGEAAKKIR